MTSLHEFLRSRFESGGFSTEDTLASFLPLVRQVLETHAAGLVAPLEGVKRIHVTDGKLWFEENDRCAIRRCERKLRQLQKTFQTTFEVMHQARRTLIVDDGAAEEEDLLIASGEDELPQPAYLPGYEAWEHQVEHHDPLTDIYSLGLILASLSCRLDFHELDDLKRFVAHRRNLFQLNPDLHPVFAQAICRMTELDRHRRPQDLAALLHSLENYREQEVDIEFDLASIPGFTSKDLQTRQQMVLSKLQERLFEISRRNRLLHFRPTMQSINLTHASIPICFDVNSIRPDHLLTWNSSLHKGVVEGKPLSLNKKLNFAEAIYLPSILDRIRAEASRDETEFGFAQLRLVACFLSWSNLKEQPHEQFYSPLILIPVKLIKRKGIRDSYFLEPLDSEAEVNPVVRHEFKTLYAIDLPESIDLTSTTLDAFFDYLHAKIQESGTGVTLQKVDKPRVDLIHQKAKRYLDQYRRRARIAGRGVRSFLDLDYSYDPANYHPLGVKLFEARIRPQTTLLQTILQNEPPSRRFLLPPEEVSAPTAEKKKAFYALRGGEDTNPYVWNFDLCSVTLANFKYRKMSLVRDYEALLTQQTENPAFEATFSLVPRPAQPSDLNPPPWKDCYHVVPCDPTQSRAIAQARTGESYIIQGPPGTGKSQTITNLIADYISQGKRVLFVCEKRAAIDVVYARLRQQGLGPLCCLIHDSQADKKAFVMDLKRTYESFLENSGLENSGGPAGRGQPDRRATLKQVQRELRPLQRFDSAMKQTTPETGLPVRQLVSRAVALEAPRQLTELEKEALPSYSVWNEHRGPLEQFFHRFGELDPSGIFARHPLRRLRPGLSELERPLDTTLAAVEQALVELRKLEALLEVEPLEGIELRWMDLRKVIAYAQQVAPLSEIRQLALVEENSEAAQQWQARMGELEKVERQWERASNDARHWKEPLPPAEVDIALQQARQMEGNWLARLTPRWWRLRKILHRSYDFDRHTIRPGWVQILTWLRHKHDAEEHVEHERERICRDLGYTGLLPELTQRIEQLRDERGSWSAAVRQLHDRLLDSPAAAEVVRRLERAAALAERVELELRTVLENYDPCRLEELGHELTSIQQNSAVLPDFLYCLRSLSDLPQELVESLRQLEMSPEQMEAVVAETSLERFFREDRNSGRFTEVTRRRHVSRLEHAHQEWLVANSHTVFAKVRDRFCEQVRLASLPASQLDSDQKEFKKGFNRGRRVLEHEFGKTMRYKSIRDLVSEESGEVVKHLKPVWLMSPLSVSDTLPLDTSHFDVVIFDEASQITLEEAVPSLFRATQTIVVGDEMQLPPTDFFSASRDHEEDELVFEEDGEIIEYDLDSNSFLTHASRNLSSWMLGWHYRSRSESLISFSNWAFYDGRLLTVPEEELPPADREELRVTRAEDGTANVTELLARPVSFHYLENGIYESRRNRNEADYIAQLVRALLARQSSVSIGIVAFSEAQQSEIENALQRLARDDRDFREQLEAEFEREEDGQFVGLLVKNLENIQGDERDVIILSVCYGYDRQGRMIMNFGPINKSGGEKRLNVAFSRAKHHMALVSSIQYTDITNEFNDGANCLKNYLRYAAAVSVGNSSGLQRVLHDISRWRSPEDGAQAARSHDAVTLHIAEQLQASGYDVDLSVGQSHFRCDIAVRVAGEDRYRLGILVDGPNHYEQPDLFDREVVRPRLLQVFGWNVAHVLSKDWLLEPRKQLTRLLELLEDARPVPPGGVPPGDPPPPLATPWDRTEVPIESSGKTEGVDGDNEDQR